MDGAVAPVGTPTPLSVGVGGTPSPEARRPTSLVIDGSGRIVHASPRARTILGARLPDLVGRPIVDLAVPEDRLRLAQWLNAHDREPTARSTAAAVPFNVSRRRGTPVSACASVVSVSERVDSTRFVVEVADVSESSSVAGGQGDLDLQERIDQLARANRELEAFARASIHDLRSPLASISASTELLVRHMGPDLDEAGQHLVGSVLRGVGQMSQLVDGLLQCSRAGHGLQIDHLDGDDLVNQAVDEARAEFEAEGAVVDVSLVGPLVGDPDQLRSVFRNLLSNALRYRAPGRPLRVSIDVEDGARERTFVVSDNGRGIVPRDRERVFGIFERLDPSVPGSGIGLATCRRIVEGHGGHISITDGKDGGTAVRFSLPDQPALAG